MPDFTFTQSPDATELWLVCEDCDEQVCVVEDRDDLEIINQCAADHAAECGGPS